MKTWYLVNDKNQVWCHHNSGNRSCGFWAVDYDAEYHPDKFSYMEKGTADRRLKAVVADGERNRKPVTARVVDRETLFELVNVEDWAHGYLNGAPDPRLEKKEARRLKREQEKEAFRRHQKVKAPEHVQPVIF